MDKLKEKLHIGSKRRESQPENDAGNVGTIEGMYTLASHLKFHYKLYSFKSCLRI